MSSYQAKRVELVPTCVACRRQNVRFRVGQSQCVYCWFWNSHCASEEEIAAARFSRKIQLLKNSVRHAMETVTDEALPHKPSSISSSNQAPSGPDCVRPYHFGTQGKHRSRYIGRMFWGFVDGQEELVESFFYDKRVRPELGSKSTKPHWLEKTLDCLPPPKAILALTRSFSNTVHAVYPVVDIPTFDGDLYIFWEWYFHNNPPPQHLKVDHTFLCLFYAVMLAGARVMSISSWESVVALKDLDQLLLLKKLEGACSESLKICLHSKYPTLNTVVASILLQHFTNHDALEDAAFVAQTVRLGQSMGLHREIRDTTVDKFSCEYRRRVWWHIEWFDVQTSLATGLPTCCASVPAEVIMVNDFEYGATTAKYKPKPASEYDARQSEPLLLAIGRYGTVGLQSRFIQYLGNISQHGDSERTHSTSQKQVAELEDAMLSVSSLIDRLEPEAPCIFVKHMLRLLQLESEIIFLKSVVSLSDSKDSSSPYAQRSDDLLSACFSYLDLYLMARREAIFEPWDWFFVGHHAPQMSAQWILLSLKKNPKHESARNLLEIVDEFLDVQNHFLATYTSPWLPESMLVLLRLRGQLDPPRKPQKVVPSRFDPGDDTDDSDGPADALTWQYVRTDRGLGFADEKNVEKDLDAAELKQLKRPWDLTEVFNFDHE